MTLVISLIAALLVKAAGIAFWIAGEVQAEQRHRAAPGQDLDGRRLPVAA